MTKWGLTVLVIWKLWMVPMTAVETCSKAYSFKGAVSLTSGNLVARNKHPKIPNHQKGIVRLTVGSWNEKSMAWMEHGLLKKYTHFRWKTFGRYELWVIRPLKPHLTRDLFWLYSCNLCCLYRENMGAGRDHWSMYAIQSVLGIAVLLTDHCLARAGSLWCGAIYVNCR